MARCTFCSAELPAAPPGASVRCPSCDNVTSTPALPPTMASAPGLPFSHVDGRKQAAAPPPTVVLPSRAGGVDELVGGGLTILGIGALKLMLIGALVLGFTCVLSMVGLLFR